MIKVRYLRISVTDRCNLRCRYCMPKGPLRSEAGDRLAPEDIGAVVDAAIPFGIDTVRITGGEPLVRKETAEIIKMISANASVRNIALTTNGTLLGEKAAELEDAGLSSANISLDTLKAARYREISGEELLSSVLSGIKAAKERFSPVKINCVVMRRVNDDEIGDFCRFADDEGVVVRFIEFMPHLDCSMEFFYSKTEIIADIRERFGEMTEVEGPQGLGPARYYKADGLKNPVGVIASVTSPPCFSCNRLRLTSDGRLLPCLYSAAHFDLKRELKDGGNIAYVLKAAIDAKGRLCAPARLNMNMAELGG